jgi:hypothetical protein
MHVYNTKNILKSDEKISDIDSKDTPHIESEVFSDKDFAKR